MSDLVLVEYLPQAANAISDQMTARGLDLKTVFEHIFEADFGRDSFGFRPRVRRAGRRTRSWARSEPDDVFFGGHGLRPRR
jgi:hypothetical protein